MEPPKTETDPDSAPLIQKIGATSIAEIEKLIGELQETRNFLESEGQRIQRETARYINLTQRASLYKPHSEGFGFRKNHL